jgi:hypothetical protein
LQERVLGRSGKHPLPDAHDFVIMELRGIRRPKFEWEEVLSATHDGRIYLLRDKKEQWFFAVVREFWVCSNGQLLHREGPFTFEEAQAAARRWFIDNPAGSTAEVLARQGSNLPEIRSFLVALNDGDLSACAALEDLAEETGIPTELIDGVRDQLFYLGIWPGEDEEEVGAA